MALTFKTSLLITAAVLLAACGGGSGGGGGGSTPPPAQDTTRPVVSVSPASFSVDSGQTASVSVSATDNVGVTSGPSVTCTNGGSFSGGTFTAPTVTSETISVCTVTAADAAGNQGTATFTATVTVPDTTPPTLSIAPLNFTVKSGETMNVDVTATDDRAVTSGPSVTCNNGGMFSGGVFTAPTVTSDTNVDCSVTASDAAGNEATGTFTAMVKVPTGFTAQGKASKGLMLGADIYIFDIQDVVDTLNPDEPLALGTVQSSVTDGTFTIDIDTTFEALGDYVLLQAFIDGASMVCDVGAGCNGTPFGGNFDILESTDPAVLWAIVPTPQNEDVTTVNLNIFSHLQSELALKNARDAGLMVVRAQDLSEAQTQVATLFGLQDQAFTELDVVDLSQDDFGMIDENTVQASILAGGVLGAASESSADLVTSLKAFFLDFRTADGELIGREILDDPDFISLGDIFENAVTTKGANSTLDPAFITAFDDIEFTVSEIQRSEGDTRTDDGGIQFGETGNFPPQFVTGVDYELSVNSTSFVQILAGDIDFDPLTFTLDPAGDGAFFNLTAGGQLTIGQPLDVNTPSDANGDNIYDLVITVDDTKDARTATIPVTITDEPANGFTLTGVASKGLMKGQSLFVYNQSLDEIASGTASNSDGQYALTISDNAFTGDALTVTSTFNNVTMVCDAPRGCGTGISFGDDFQLPDDQNASLSATILTPAGGSEVDVHINVFTQLVTFHLGNNIEPPSAASLTEGRDAVASLLNVVSQDYTTLDFVDVTDPSVNPADVDSAIAALLSAGVLGAALENPGRVENALINFYFEFVNGTVPVDDGGDLNRISLVDIWTQASEIRAANPSTDPVFIQALDKIDADLAAATTP